MATTQQSKVDMEFNKNEDAMKLLISDLKHKLDVVHLGGGQKENRQAPCKRQDDGP